MKLKDILLASLMAGGLLTACTKSDLFKAPENAISADDVFSTPDRIEKASVGMYDALQNPNFFGGRVLIYADIRGLDAIPNAFFGQMGFYSSTNSSDGTVATAYQGAYRTIYQANLFIKGFTPKMDLVTQAKADQYIGEAKFIRSLCFFYLVNLWAQPYNFTADASHPGIPLVLQVEDDPFSSANELPRSSVKAVYDQMETDLLDALTKLPDNPADAFTKVARATKGAANALLARIYLYKGDWAKANASADAVIASAAGYGLNAGNPIIAFRPPYTTKESIFSVAQSGADNPNTNNSLGQHYGAKARGDISISLNYINLMDTSVDLRFRAKGGDSLVERTGAATFWTKKYAGLTTDFVPVLRYAEILLIKAEALARQSAAIADPDAIILLNQVRARSNASVLAPVTQAELIDDILKERRIELAFEGQGSFDFNRNKLDIPVHSGVPLQAWGSDYRVLPIPKYETDKNKKLNQNKGY
jgi:hypothetical protein